MAKKKKKDYKVPFDHWILMLNEGYYDIDFNTDKLTLDEFLEKLREYFE